MRTSALQGSQSTLQHSLLAMMADQTPSSAKPKILIVERGRYCQIVAIICRYNLIFSGSWNPNHDAVIDGEADRF
jgi:hypothetical protein